MAQIPEQLEKIDNNIREAQEILNSLRQRPRTEQITEQIEHFESMLNKLNALKESYLHLYHRQGLTDSSKQVLLPSNIISNSNDTSITEQCLNISNDFGNQSASMDHLQQLKQERDRLKKKLQDKELKNNSLQQLITSEMNVEMENEAERENMSLCLPFSNGTADCVTKITLDATYYVPILSHHIEIGSKMLEIMGSLNFDENIQKGLNLLREVIHQLVELKKKFQYIENQKNTPSIHIGEEENDEHIQNYSTVMVDLHNNFTTGISCFKSAMDSIQTCLDVLSEANDAESTEIGKTGVALNDTFQNIGNLLKTELSCANEQVPIAVELNVEDGMRNGKNSNIDNSEVRDRNVLETEEDSEDNRELEDKEENDVDNKDEDEDSCREKDQDESMEIAVNMNAEPDSEQLDQETMKELKRQTEVEKNEILRLLEEKRIMQQKLAELKEAKELAQKQMLKLTECADGDKNYSSFAMSSETDAIDGSDDEEDRHKQNESFCSRPESLSLKNKSLIREMESIFKLLSDVQQVNGEVEQTYPRLSSLNISQINNDIKSGTMAPSFNLSNTRNYEHGSDLIYDQFTQKAEELKQKQAQIEQLQEMLCQIKKGSRTLEESTNNDSNDQYSNDINANRDINNSVRNSKGRDSVTFQEPIATFIANEELYENMREVRMMREELRERSRDRKSRTGASTRGGSEVTSPRSPGDQACGVGTIVGSTGTGNDTTEDVSNGNNVPGAPPEAPSAANRIVLHDTASQDRTTAATWGSSSAGGDDDDDYETVANRSGNANAVGGSRLHQRNGNANNVNLSHHQHNHLINDEGSRVAPVGQSSSFRGKVVTPATITPRGSNYFKNINTDFHSLESQLDSITNMCRTMAVEQSRLSKEISDLKRSNANTRVYSLPTEQHQHLSSIGGGVSGADGGNQLGLITNPKQIPHQHHLSVTTTTNEGESVGSSAAFNQQFGSPPATNGPLLRHNVFSTAHQLDPSWEEVSITSSNLPVAPGRQLIPLQNNALYAYQNMLQNQNLLLQNHTMFMKFQMSLFANQMEQQRLLLGCSGSSGLGNVPLAHNNISNNSMQNQYIPQFPQVTNSVPGTNMINRPLPNSYAPTFYPPSGHGYLQSSDHVLNGDATVPTSSTNQLAFSESDYPAYTCYNEGTLLSSHTIDPANWKTNGSAS